MSDEVLYEVRGPKTLFEMTWPQVKELLTKTKTVVIPVGSTERPCESSVKGVMEQARLPGARDAGHDGQRPAREPDVELREVVRGGPQQLDPTVPWPCGNAPGRGLGASPVEVACGGLGRERFDVRGPDDQLQRANREHYGDDHARFQHFDPTGPD